MGSNTGTKIAGTNDEKIIDRWYRCVELLGAEQIVEELLRFLPAEYIERFVKVVERNYEIDDDIDEDDD